MFEPAASTAALYASQVVGVTFSVVYCCEAVLRPSGSSPVSGGFAEPANCRALPSAVLR